MQLSLNAYVLFEIEERYRLGGVALFIVKHCLNNDEELAILAKIKIFCKVPMKFNSDCKKFL